MGDKLIEGIITVATAVVGLAIIAVLVSGSAQTSSVLSSATTGFGNVLKAATAPVSSGAGLSLPNLNLNS